MTSQPITPDFEEAVSLYVEWAEQAATRSSGIVTIPEPNRRLSELLDGEWYLVDVNGPLAKVTAKRTVSRLTEGQWEEASRKAIQVHLDDVGGDIHITSGRFGFQLEPCAAGCLQKQLKRIVTDDESDGSTVEGEATKSVLVDDVADDWKTFRIWIEPAWFELSYEEVERLSSKLQPLTG